ncbi:MAG TPA: BCAM0308 family protein [Pyrinomonadaceae bacterium]|nr:BCAM0308 family protein [Pyrinomonadaceae bacterium]
MRGRKRYDNVTFTKRVDHEAGRHRGARAISEPAVCRVCGALYVNRRWQGASGAIDARSARVVDCPACLQMRNGSPRGFVYLDGSFYVTHQKEIEQLLRNEAARAEADNPLARIMEFTRGKDHNLTVSTTTEHLAQRLGHALEKAFAGHSRYDFSHENKLARVTWER